MKHAFHIAWVVALLLPITTAADEQQYLSPTPDRSGDHIPVVTPAPVESFSVPANESAGVAKSKGRGVKAVPAPRVEPNARGLSDQPPGERRGSLLVRGKQHEE